MVTYYILYAVVFALTWFAIGWIEKKLNSWVVADGGISVKNPGNKNSRFSVLLTLAALGLLMILGFSVKLVITLIIMVL